MSLESRAEVRKISRELQVSAEALDGLTPLAPGDLRHLRGLVADALHEAHRPAFSRAASASALLPTALTARLAQSLIGPYLAARIAAEMPADRAVKLAGHLDVAFLADVCMSLDPARVAATVRGLAEERVLAVGMELLHRGEYVTLGRFVDLVPPGVLDEMTRRVTDPDALLQIATAVEARHRLDDLVRRIDDDRLRAMVEVAVARDAIDPVATLIVHLGPGTRARLARLARQVAPDRDEFLPGPAQASPRPQEA